MRLFALTVFISRYAFSETFKFLKLKRSQCLADNAFHRNQRAF